MEELVKGSTELKTSDIAKIMGILARSPLALHTPPTAPLLSIAVDRFRFSLDDVSVSDIAKTSVVLAQTRVFPKKNKNESAQASMAGEVLSARALLWNQLLPRGFKGLDKGQSSHRVELLLAAALGWRTLADNNVKMMIQPSLKKAVAVSLDDPVLWQRNPVNPASPALFIGALGLLNAQAALSRSSKSEAQQIRGIVRRFDRESLQQVNLSSVLLLDLGLRALGLESSLLGSEVRKQVALHIAATTSRRRSVRHLCDALLMMKSCGRLAPREPWVFELVCTAANASDRLQPSERYVLSTLLDHLNDSLRANQQQEFQPGSVEASIRVLSRYNWFARRNRSEISWYQQRCL